MPRPKGYKVTEETKQKISQHHFGIRPNAETRQKQSLAKIGKPSTMLGRHHTEESKRKNSIAHRGSKSSWWKGGISALSDIIRRSLEYRLWRKSVFERDGYTCVLCGANKKYLNADHIKQLALILIENSIKTLEEALQCDELWQINNGRTLCIDCHKETETYLNKGRRLIKNK